MITFAPDDEPQKRLMTRHRVVFDAIYSRTTRLVRFLIRNPQKAQSPEFPLYKDILRILAKLRKILDIFSIFTAIFPYAFYINICLPNIKMGGFD